MHIAKQLSTFLCKNFTDPSHRMPVHALSAAIKWWHEYGHDTILLKDV